MADLAHVRNVEHGVEEPCGGGAEGANALLYGLRGQAGGLAPIDDLQNSLGRCWLSSIRTLTGREGRTGRYTACAEQRKQQEQLKRLQRLRHVYPLA